MTIKELPNGFVSISADEGCTLRRVGTPDDKTNICHSVAVKATCADDWEEVQISQIDEAKAVTEQKKAYDAKVVALIRERYTADDETAILRKYVALNSQPQPFSDEELDRIVTEFDEYNSFAEECKLKAKGES